MSILGKVPWIDAGKLEGFILGAQVCFLFCVSFSGNVAMGVTRYLGKVSASVVGKGVHYLLTYSSTALLFILVFIIT